MSQSSLLTSFAQLYVSGFVSVSDLFRKKNELCFFEIDMAIVGDRYTVSTMKSGKAFPLAEPLGYEHVH